MSWENDARGKPHKWLKQITIEQSDNEQEVALKRKAIEDACRECGDAIKALMATGEYVVIVEPEVKWVSRDEDDAKVYVIRARVRWVTPDAKANRERNLRAMFEAVDDEFEKIMTERAGGKPN